MSLLYKTGIFSRFRAHLSYVRGHISTEPVGKTSMESSVRSDRHAAKKASHGEKIDQTQPVSSSTSLYTEIYRSQKGLQSWQIDVREVTRRA